MDCSTGFKNMKKYEEMTRQELIRELKLLSLRRQVTPHFLFNSISVAVSLVMKSPAMAVTFLRHLALMYRYLMRYGNEYHVPVEQELEMMQQYYVLMSIRHVDSIKLNVAPEVKKLKGCPMPPLALQGLLENAIKHNTHTKENPLKVDVTLERGDDGGMWLCMKNNIVPLLSPADSTKLGLAYIRETIQLLLAKDIIVENDGSIYKIMIPMVKDFEIKK